jgi:hypothetical protein
MANALVSPPSVSSSSLYVSETVPGSTVTTSPLAGEDAVSAS